MELMFTKLFQWLNKICNSYKIRKMRILLILILSLIQLPCVIEGWISYFLNCIVKLISDIIFLLAIISIRRWPLDMLCGALWAGCECLKQKLFHEI